LMSEKKAPPPDSPASNLTAYIPEGWKVEFDQERRLVFYINLRTHETQWTPPTSPAHSREASPDYDPPYEPPHEHRDPREPPHEHRGPYEPPNDHKGPYEPPHDHKGPYESPREHNSRLDSALDHITGASSSHTNTQGSTPPKKQGNLSNILSGMGQGFMAARYGSDNPAEQRSVGYGLGARRRRRHQGGGGLIHSAVGGIGGGIKGAKNPPVQQGITGQHPQPQFTPYYQGHPVQQGIVGRQPEPQFTHYQDIPVHETGHPDYAPPPYEPRK